MQDTNVHWLIFHPIQIKYSTASSWNKFANQSKKISICDPTTTPIIWFSITIQLFTILPLIGSRNIIKIESVCFFIAVQNWYQRLPAALVARSFVHPLVSSICNTRNANPIYDFTTPPVSLLLKLTSQKLNTKRETNGLTDGRSHEV